MVYASGVSTPEVIYFKAKNILKINCKIVYRLFSNNLSLFQQKQKAMTTSKVYNSFSDKFGTTYSFDNYMAFASFWFNLSRKAAQSFFPTNFKDLQRAAANSKEARTKVAL